MLSISEVRRQPKKRKKEVVNGKRINGGQLVMKQKRLSTYFKKRRLEDDDRIKELTDRVERLEKLVEILTKKLRRRKRSGFTPRKDVFLSLHGKKRKIGKNPDFSGDHTRYDDDSRRAEGFIGGSPAFDVGEGSAPDLVAEDLGAHARNLKDESSRDEEPVDDMAIGVEPMDEEYLEAEAKDSESAGAVETRSANQGDDGLGAEPGDVDEADVEGESEDSESSGAVDSMSPPNEDDVEEENVVEEEVDGSGLYEPEDEDAVVEEADGSEFSEQEEEAECSESSDRKDDDAVEEEGDGSESSEPSDVVIPLKEGDGIPRQWVVEGVKGYRGAILYWATTSNLFYVTDEEGSTGHNNYGGGLVITEEGCSKVSGGEVSESGTVAKKMSGEDVGGLDKLIGAIVKELVESFGDGEKEADVGGCIKSQLGDQVVDKDFQCESVAVSEGGVAAIAERGEEDPHDEGAQVFDADVGANESVTCLSDSSPCERSEKHKPEELEGNRMGMADRSFRS
ncbi:unnamed protein product [Eruca vesicaria subsp. sativa]|uniref:Uncharacterized protein n=1 Tax=Eruca vesicaria subsp. sativa TaxID=29727 RepID=A0ABC8K6M0_ERUVS|nr:unnamed protein product [Eruca vesicaria subsp. sativa]